MAKKRQSSKATDKSDAETATPDDLEKSIPDAVEKPEGVSAEGTEKVDIAGTDEVTAPEADDARVASENDTDGDLKPEEAQEPEAEENRTDEVASEDATDKPEERENTAQTDDAVLAEPQAEDADKPEEPRQEAEKAPETVAIVPAPQPKTEIVRGSIWPGFFGGVIAALIGFIVGRGDALDSYLPASLQRPSVDTTALEAESAALAAQAEAIKALAEAQEARIAALEATASEPLAAPAPAVDLSGLEQEIARLTDRLSQVEARPAETVTVDDTAAQEALAAIAGLESALEAQTAELEALAAQAADAEKRAAGEAARLLARAALMRVQVAVDSGETFSPALTELEEVTPVDVPVALRDAAEVGVPTLAALQDSFPDAARAGLAAARAEVPEGDVEGIGGFLRRQLNVRSVTPREGSDPDAVLSRAQAAVRAGDLATALSEMEALPDAARAAMQDWLEAASARKAAQDAANELADSLNSN